MRKTYNDIKNAANSLIEDIEELIRLKAEEITDPSVDDGENTFDEVVENYDRILKELKKQL